MPRINNASDWEKGLRASVRASTAKGWSVREDKGKVRLEVRTERLKGSATLPFDWSRSNVGDVVTRARNVYSLVQGGHDLRDVVNPGNSGGPIVNYNGEVLGIVTSKMVALGVEGIGFGISLPSALESLGVKITQQKDPKLSDMKAQKSLSSCGNLAL